MWTWQHPDWPNFRYDAAAVRLQVDEFRLKSERLMGRMEALPADLHTDAVIGLMLSEAIKTSAIEGESLDRDSVRASLLQLMAQDTVAPRHQDEKAAGAAALMVDVRQHWAEPLDDGLLGRWQSMVVVHQPLSLVMRGLYRNAPEPMRMVSGVDGRQRIDYEAPPAARVYEEMARLLDWYNQTNPLTAGPAEVIPGPVRAAIAHAWFDTKRFASAPGRRLIVICRRWSRWACSNPCPAVDATRVTSCENPDQKNRTDRSILANPAVPSMKDTINAKIKRRESFRPFAPSVLKEVVGSPISSWSKA